MGLVLLIVSLIVPSLEAFGGFVEEAPQPRYEGADIALNDFEDASLLYINSENNTEMFWRYQAGSTPSGNTGPSNDHSYGNETGHYYYIETSGNVKGDNAKLYSPWYDLNGFECVTFYTHMYGTQIGALNVHLEMGGKFEQLISLTEELGDEWIKQTMAIDAPGIGRLVFEGIKGEDLEGDVAFDDVVFMRDCGFEYSWRLSETRVNSSQSTGLLEVKRTDTDSWGAVCADSIDQQTGDVLCVWSGYKVAIMADSASVTSPKFLDKLHCPFDAVRMSDCQRYGWSEKECVNGTELTCDSLRCMEGQGEIEVRSCGECDFGEWGPGDDVCHPCPEGFSTVNTSSTKEKDCLDERLIRCEEVEGVKQCRQVYCACDFTTQTCNRGICYPRVHHLLSTNAVIDIAQRVERMPWYSQVSNAFQWAVWGGGVQSGVEMVSMGVNWAVMVVLGFEL